MSDNATQYRFPFFGAGDATYFEWAKVTVRFHREPTADEQARILERLPPPLRQTEVPFRGRDLLACSDQMAHMHIIEHYEADDGDEPEMDGRFVFAAQSQVDRFNADIEAWLRAADEICPIAVAYRAEDGESGGTQLSAWHTASLQRLPELIPLFDDVLNHGADDIAEHTLIGILAMAHGTVTLPEPLRAWWQKQQDGEVLDNAPAAAETTVDIIAQLQAPDADLARFNAVAHSTLSFARENRFSEALDIFDILIQRSDLDRATYCNALWLVMADNNHLPIDPPRARRYLELCLPHAPNNPAIYFNAALIHMELGEPERALEQLALAIQHDDDDELDMAQIKEEPLLKPLASDPRFVALFE